MIQRIQSVYLIFAILLGGLSFYFSLEMPHTMKTLVRIDSNYVFLISPIVSLITFSLFKKRPIQAVLCFFNIILLVLQLLLFIPGFRTIDGFGFEEAIILFYLLGIILLWLARRAIQKDEALVRSVDRIR